MKVLNYVPKIFLVIATLSLASCDTRKNVDVPAKQQLPGKVVLLNGTSSAGKTTMLNELKKIDDTIKVISFDGFWGPYTKAHPTDELDELAKIARIDENAKQKLNKLAEAYVRNAFDSFYAQIKDEALKYNIVIVDTVIEDVKEFDKLAQALGGIPLTNVVLYCPLDITLERLRQRNIAGIDPRDFRQPVSQYKLLYKPQEQPSEVVVDTIISKDLKQLVRAGIDEYLKNPPEDLKDQIDLVAKELEDLYKDFVKHFKLDDLEKVVIVPVRPYALILNCKKSTQERAQELSDFIKSTPKIVVTPNEVLIDQPVEISISNLKPNQQITVEASCKNKDNDAWKSYAVFQADEKGIVNVVRQAPISGSYKGVDPMGLFWSMTPTDKEILKKVPPTFNFLEVSLSVFVENKLRAHMGIQRLPIASNIEKKIIREEGIVGTLFYPKTMQHGPGVIHVGGSGGRIPEDFAQLIASHGYTVLALGFFGVEGLPDRLKNIPLEYFQKAMKWFKKLPQVDPDHIALSGRSRGGELVLLLEQHSPKRCRLLLLMFPVVWWEQIHGLIKTSRYLVCAKDQMKKNMKLFKKVLSQTTQEHLMIL